MKVVGFLLLIGMIIVLWLFPTAAPALGIGFLLFSLLAVFVSIFKKHREVYRQGKITRAVFARNVFVEILGILLSMALAGLLGKTLAQIATKQIDNNATELITVMVIGLLAGMGIGVLVRRIWVWLVQVQIRE